MPEPIKWHADEAGVCSDECEAWQADNCPWLQLHGGEDVPRETLGDACPVHKLLRLIGRSPSPRAAALPTCETCPYFEEVDETCRASPPTGRPSHLFAFPKIERRAWCAKHPKVEALRMRSMMAPAQAAFADMAASLASLKGEG